jgi:hypothetical protein
MSFKLPKGFPHVHIGQGFDLLLPILPADIDADRMMTTIIELCLFNGYRSISNTQTEAGDQVDSESRPKGFERYLASLVDGPKIVGLENQQRKEVIQSWIKAMVIKIGRSGKSRTHAQMDYPRPLTAVGYRSGLPKNASRNRGADSLVYTSIRDELRRQGVGNPASELAILVRSGLSSGIEPGTQMDRSPWISDQSEVDISALISVWFFNEFPLVVDGGGKKKHIDSIISVPGAASPIGRDVLKILRYFAPLMSPTESISHLTALIALRLFQLPLRVATSLSALLSSGDFTDDFLQHDAKNSSQMYCDFTEIKNSASNQLSRFCVRRDLETMRKSLGDRILLRTLDLLNQDSTVVPRPQIDTSKANAIHFERDREKFQKELPEYFHSLIQNRYSKDFEIASKYLIRTLDNLLIENGDEDGQEFVKSTLQAVGPIDALVRVITEHTQSDAITNGGKWFKESGGLNSQSKKSYAILEGSDKHKSTWKYRISDDLLTSLLLAAFANNQVAQIRQQMPIRELLDFLREEFGLLIAEPPAAYDNASSRAAASYNREAFVRRLQLLGVFRGLSDDFEAQDVRCPREPIGGFGL